MHNFDYAKMSNADAEEAREGLFEKNGFFIPPSELFCNVNGRADNDKNLNETLERVFKHIEASAKRILCMKAALQDCQTILM